MFQESAEPAHSAQIGMNGISWASQVRTDTLEDDTEDVLIWARQLGQGQYSIDHSLMN